MNIKNYFKHQKYHKKLININYGISNICDETDNAYFFTIKNDDVDSLLYILNKIYDEKNIDNSYNENQKILLNIYHSFSILKKAQINDINFDSYFLRQYYKLIKGNNFDLLSSICDNIIKKHLDNKDVKLYEELNQSEILDDINVYINKYKTLQDSFLNKIIRNFSKTKKKQYNMMNSFIMNLKNTIDKNENKDLNDEDFKIEELNLGIFEEENDEHINEKEKKHNEYFDESNSDLNDTQNEKTVQSKSNDIANDPNINDNKQINNEENPENETNIDGFSSSLNASENYEQNENNQGLIQINQTNDASINGENEINEDDGAGGNISINDIENILGYKEDLEYEEMKKKQNDDEYHEFLSVNNEITKYSQKLNEENVVDFKNNENKNEIFYHKKTYYAAQISQLVKKLEYQLLSSSIKNINNQENGKIDISKFMTIINSPNERDVFKNKKIIKDKTNLVISILIDTSLSMSKILETAQDSLLIISETLLFFNIKHSIHSYSTSGTGNGVTLKTIKEYEDRNAKKVYYPAASGGTPTGKALFYVFEKLKKRREQRKVIFLLTDGEPDSLTETQKVMSFLKHYKIETVIIGIGRGGEAVEHFAEQYVVIENEKDLKHGVLNELEKILQFGNNKRNR